MKRSFLQRALALVLSTSLAVTSVPVNVFAEEAVTEERQDGETGIVSESKTESEPAKNEESVQSESVQSEASTKKEDTTSTEETESEEKTDASADVEQNGEQTSTELNVESLSKDAVTENDEDAVIEKQSESQEESETNTDTEASTETLDTEVADAYVTVIWSDESDISGGRTGLEGSDFLTVYADGHKMEKQPKIHLDSTQQKDQYGVQWETYVIENLPIYKEDSETQIDYCVKEENEELLESYKALDLNSFKDADESVIHEILQNSVGPDSEIELTYDESDKFYSEKQFGNYLPVYEEAAVNLIDLNDDLVPTSLSDGLYMEDEGDDGVMLADTDTEGPTKSVMGFIEWNDKANDWYEQIRPTEAPSDPNEWITLWKYSEGHLDHAMKVELQSSDSSAPNYFKITPTEGLDVWSYSIGSVKAGDNEHFYVTGPGFGSYKASTSGGGEKADTSGNPGDVTTGEVKLENLVYEPDFQPLTITKNLVPADSTDKFSFNVTTGTGKVPYKGDYTVGTAHAGTESKNTTNGSITGVGGGQSAILQIPTGVAYELTENPVGSYKTIYDDAKSGTITADGSSTIVTNVSNNVTISMNKIWNDNNDPGRSGDKFKAALITEYSIDGGTTWNKLDADALKLLGVYGNLTYEWDEINPGRWTVYAVHGADKNFPAAQIQKKDDGTDEVKIIQYRLTEKENVEGYISSTAADGTVTNTKAEDFKADILWKDKDDDENRPPEVELTLTGYYYGPDGRKELTTEEFAAFGVESTTFNQTVKHDTADDADTKVEIKDLPMYTKDGYPITYYMQQTKLDNYSIEYDNKDTAYGTNVTQCYNGGTITNVRCDNTTYSAKKIWIDAGGNKENRPIATVYLYRYEKGEDPDTASPVVIRENDGKSHVLCRELPADTDSGVEYTFDFDDILNAIDNPDNKEDGGHKLYKYNGDGREYVYFVKEVLTAKTDEETGKHTSAPYFKSYKDADGKPATALYEGGTLTNSRMPMVDVNVGKQWITASYPDSPAGTEVQLKVKVSSDGDNWEYLKGDDGEDLIVTVNGFSSGQGTRSQTITLPQYTEDGKTLQYQAEEISVKKGSTELLDGNTVTLDGHTYLYTPGVLDMATVPPSDDPDENAEADLLAINKLDDKADYVVEKKWVGMTPEDTYVVTVNVDRYLHTGEKDTSFETKTVHLTLGDDSDTAWTYIIKDLPLYDDEGYRYDYRAVEEGVTDNDTPVEKTWGTIYDYKYDLENIDKKITATITNYVGDGGKYITVSKVWNDDGDVQHRLPVVAQVYDSDGNEWTGKQATLSADNGWTARIYFEKNDEKNEIAKYDEGITVREKTVGGYEVSYTAAGSGDAGVSSADADDEDGGDADAGAFVPAVTEGKVTTSKTDGHIYKVVNTPTPVGENWVITNTRIGQIKVVIDKEWIDGDRDNDERPSVTATIYRDGALYNDENITDGKVTMSADCVDENDSNKWVYSTEWLPKYDENGKQYVYTVSEVDTAALKADDYVSQLEDGTYDITNSEYHSGDEQHFTLTNKREGITDYKVYKIWKDTELTSSRPDIRVGLYYSLGDEEIIYAYGDGPMKDYQTAELDYIWSAPKAGSGADYDRMCQVPDLMKYSPEDGSEIHYYSKETMTVPGDYNTYYWETAAKAKNAVHGGEACAANEEYIENRLEANINLKGTKLWLNLQNGTQPGDLDTSKITITLYHYVGKEPDVFKDKTASSGNETGETGDGGTDSGDAPVPSGDESTDPEGAQGTSADSIDKYKAAEIVLGEKSSDNRNFQFTNVPKYDENGRLYTYVMREKIDGKMGYVYTNDPAGFQISNTFVTGPENNRVIQVIKEWDSREYTDAIKAGQEFEYPKAVFKLYRSAGKSDTDNGIDLNGKPIATITLSAVRGQSSGTMVFPAQLIWSENGIQYKYAVVEVVDGVPAYQIPSVKQTVYISDKDRNGNDITYTPENKPGVRTAYFENTYEPKTGLRLQGAKYWKDENGAHRPDPKDLVLNVYRSAPGTSLSTAIPEKRLECGEGKDYTINWQTKTDKNCWYYTIQGPAITQFAPNGQRWVYRIEEVVPDHYEVSGDAYQRGSVTNANLQLMTDITNSLTGTYTVSKVWDDNNNEYQLRPVSVVVVLQRKKLGAADAQWEYVEPGNNKDGNYSVPGNDEESVNALSVELSYAANKWSYTFTKLDPTYEYRGVEVAAGVKDSTGERELNAYWQNKEDGTTRNMIGSYTIRYDYSNGKTTVTNKLDPTTLTVTKHWLGDNNNYYDSRPVNAAGVPAITVKIQRRYANQIDEADWKDIIDSKGNTFTKVLSSSKNGITWEIKNLPKCDYSGKAYVYRAVEENLQGYSAVYENNNLNNTVIKNSLIERNLNISVKKIWSEGIVDSHYPVVIELTRWVSSDQGSNIKVPYPKPMTVTLDGTADDMTNAIAGESSAWVATWNHLPKSDNDGRDYTYKVEEISINGVTVANKKAAGYLVDNGVENDELMVGNSDSEVEIRNTLAMEYTVSKEFIGDAYAARPSSITVQLQRTTATTINESTSWENVGNETEIKGFTNENGKTDVSTGSHTFTDLPKYDANNNLYTYRAIETKIGSKNVMNNFASGYDVTYKAANTDATHYGSKITNTMRTINITGTKEWDDQNNVYSTRPSTVTVKLYANDALVAKQPTPTWTKNGNIWTFTFSNLPQYDVNGDKIVYTVKEPTDNVPKGYTAVNNSLTGGFADAAVSTSASKTTVNVSGTYNSAAHGIINKLETVDVEGTKTWTNTINGSGTAIQPNGIILTLKNGNATVNVPIAKYTAPTASNSWTYKFADVPKYDSTGATITYTVEETAVPGYSTSYTTGTDGKKNVTNTLDTTTVTAVKIWDDQSNAYGMRPSDWKNTVFTVYADGVEMGTQPTSTWTVDKSNGNKFTFTAKGLQKYKLVDNVATEIVYTVQEKDTSVPKGYTKTVSTDGKTVTNSLATVNVKGTKTWSESKNGSAASIRPQSITLKLMNGSNEVTVPSGKYTLTNTGDSWSYEYADVPKYDSTGAVISYTVAETVVPGYTTTYSTITVSNDGKVITTGVTNTLDTTTVTAVKIWDDQSNAYGMRPSTWNNTDGTGLFSVYADGTKMTTQPTCSWTVDESDANKYTFTATGLQKYKLVNGNKTEIVYTVQEDTIPNGYSRSVSGSNITNTLTTVNVEGTKTWSETKNGSAAAIRPGSITLTLKNDTKTVTVPTGTLTWTKPDTGNVWTYKYTGLPKYDKDGNEITYKVVETAVPGYTESRDTTNNNLITNTLDTVNLTATKVWVDQNDKYSTRPSGWNNTNGTGLFAVYADYGDGNGYVNMTTQPTCTWTGAEATDGSGTYTFEAKNLQKYNLVSGSAVEIKYEVREVTVPAAYTKTEEVSDKGVKTITNTLDVSTINVTKNWVDNSDTYGLRPSDLTLTLQWKKTLKAGGETEWSDVTPQPSVTWTKSTEETKKNTWTCAFADLPDKDVNGNTYSYRVKETVPTGYYSDATDDTVTAAITGGSGNVAFTNTLYTVNIEGTKTWDDQGDFYKLRPTGITVKLYNGTTEVANQPNPTWTKPTEEAQKNTWTFKFSGLPMFNAKGERISYSVKEVGNITGYTVSNNALTGDFSKAANGSTVTVAKDEKGIINTLDTVTVSGTKTWTNTINGSGPSIQPEGITLTLKNGDTAVTVPAGTLTWTKPETGNVWSYKYTNLPKYDKEGKVVTYTVVETAVPGYTESRDTTNNNLITNTLDTVDLTAKKVWVDQNNKYSTRPSGWNNTNGTGLFAVYADYGDGNGYVKMTTQPTCTWTGAEAADGTGTYTFKAENLQKYNLLNKGTENEKLVEIKYEVQEVTVPGAYTKTESVSDKGVKTVTNTLATSSINVTKNWADNSNAYGTRPDNLAITLQWKTAEDKDWSNVTPQPTVTWTKNADNTWTCTYTGLPNKNAAGKDYSYRIKETVPTGYSSGVTDDTVEAVFANGTGTVAFTNTFDHGYVQINKVFGETGNNGNNTKPLSTFKIENEAKTRSFIVKTDTKGKFVIDSTDGSYTGTDGNKFWLIPGKYTITEQSAESLTDGCRFTVDTNSYEFTIVKDQTVVVSNEKDDAGLFRNNPVRGALILTKMDEKYIVEDNKLVEKTDNGELLGGAEFNICLDKDGKQIVTALVPVEDKSGEAQAGLYTLPADTASELTNSIGVPYLTNGKLLCGTYYIIETGVPEGYYVKDSQSPKQITIGADANAAIIDVTPEMENTLIEKPFKISKDFEAPNVTAFDAEGKDNKIGDDGAVSKADDNDHVFEFTIERSADSKPAFAYTNTVKTDKDGIADFGNIPYGTYTVTETEVKDYIPLSETVITVDSNGVTFNKSTLDGGKLAVSNVLKRSSITGTVIDKEYNDILLENAVVGLYKGDVLVGKVTTDKDGKYSFTDIPYGDYTVKEIKSPENYVLDETPISVSVQNNGENITLDPIENLPVKVTVSIHKVDNETGNAMKDVVFTLTGTDFRGKEVVQGTGDAPLKTDANGNLTFAPVTVGEYAITETKVTNYAAPHSLKLTVTNVEDGNSNKAAFSLVDTSAGKDVASLIAANDDGTYTITNIRIRRNFSFSKVGTDDELDLTKASALAGAQFGLYDNKKAEGDVAQTVESGTDGKVTFTDIPCGIWYVKEISAPANYKLDTNIYSVTVAQDGTVTSDLETVVNEAIRGKIEFTKVDKEHHDITIIGAEYTLYKKNTESGEYDAVTTVTSDKDGKVVFDNLLIGTDYRVAETVTVTNYLLAEYTADFALKLEKGAAVTEVKDSGNGTVEETDDGMLWNEEPVIHQFKIAKDYEVPNATAADAEGKKIGESGNYATADNTDNCFQFTIERTADSVPEFAYKAAVKTDASGIADFGTIPYGTYTVTETTVDDYLVNEAFTIVVDENGIKRDNAVLRDGVTKVHNTLKRGSISGTVIDKEYNDILLGGAEVGLYNEDGVLVGKVTTGKDGSFKFDNIPYGKYSVAEIKAPENYVLDPTPIKNIVIKNNGDEITLDPIENLPVKVTVSIHKIDNETGKAMKDVEFILTGTDFRGKEVSQGTSDAPLKTDADGNLTFAPVTVGEYAIAETKVTNYEAPHSLKLTVANVEDGNSNKAAASLVDTSAGKDVANLVKANDDDSYTITNICIRRNFSFSKVGTDNELDLTKASALAGAQFGLYDNEKAEGDAVQTVESGTNGKVTFKDIPCGTWYVKEISAPANYKLDTNIYSITVAQDGTVTSDLKTVVNEAIRGKIEFTKVDKEHQDITIAGAEYTLSKKNSESGEYEAVTTVTSDKNGKVVFDNLLIGTDYRVAETATVTNYLLAEHTADFALKLENGVVAAELKDSGNGTVEESDNGMLWNELRVGMITFDKKAYFNESCAESGSGIDPSAIKPLKGAEFTIYESNHPEKAVATASSDEDGKVYFANVKYGNYIVKETKAPEGYEQDKNSYFAVVNYQTFEGLKSADGTLVKDNTLINDIYRATITLKKVNEQNPSEVLPDSRYGLYRVEEDGTLVFVSSSVTDKDGYLSFQGVRVGTNYIVKEMEAPDGSYVSEKPVEIEFALNDKGEVSISNFKDGNGTAELDPVTGEIVWNEPSVEVVISKVDEKGKLLAGATLQIVDADGKEVMQWTSGKEAKLISRVLIIGQTYELRELKAPAGYEVANPITIKIDDASVGPNENKQIQITMVDKAKKDASDNSDDSDESDKKAETNADGTPATGDNTDMMRYLYLLLGSAAVILIRRRKRNA